MSVSFWLASRVRRWFSIALVSVLSVVLVVAGFPVTAGAAPVESSPKRLSVLEAGVEPTGTGLVRPNFVSASVTARASGERVEVLSERSEWSRSWVEPSGGVTVESLVDEVRFRDPSAGDGWRDVDTTLVRNVDGSWSPRAVAERMVLAGGGRGALIVRDERLGGRLVVDPVAGVSWPVPVVEGSTATYAEVRPGVDVRVTVRPGGFEFVWVVKSRQAARGFLRSRGKARGAVAVVRSSQGRPVLAAGGVEFGQGRGRFGTPLAWDAATTEAGDPVSVVEAEFAVTDPDAAGASEVSVEVPASWWDDPARVWPVTVDPVYASATATPNFDTYVSQAYANTDLSTQASVRIGFDGTNKQRTWLNFDTSPMYGKQVTGATLQLWNYQSWTCSARAWTAYDAAPASTASRWASMPWFGGPIGSSTQTRGSGCASGSGWVNVEIPSWIQAWADNRWGVRGIMVASDESSAAGHKKFNSSEAGSGPRLVWSYNRAPAIPLDWAAPSPGAQLADGAWYAPSTSPTVTFRVGNDPDGDPVYGDAYFTSSSSSTPPSVSSGWCSSLGTVGFDAGGAWHWCASPQGWPQDSIVYAWVRTSDGRSASAWFGPQPIRIASGKPAAPVVSCTVPNGSWTVQAPSGAVACEVRAAGVGFSAPNRVRVSIDGAADVEVGVPQSSDPNVAKASVVVPNTAGGHSVRAVAVGPAGVSSDASVYGFGFGSAGLQFPTQGSAVTTTDRVRVEATAPKAAGAGGLPSAVVQWRVAGRTDEAGWLQVDASAVSVKRPRFMPLLIWAGPR